MTTSKCFFQYFSLPSTKVGYPLLACQMLMPAQSAHCVRRPFFKRLRCEQVFLKCSLKHSTVLKLSINFNQPPPQMLEQFCNQKEQRSFFVGDGCTETFLQTETKKENVTVWIHLKFKDKNFGSGRRDSSRIFFHWNYHFLFPWDFSLTTSAESFLFVCSSVKQD